MENQIKQSIETAQQDLLALQRKRIFVLEEKIHLISDQIDDASRVKGMLSYMLGDVILRYFRKPYKLPLLPFAIYKNYQKFKREKCSVLKSNIGGYKEFEVEIFNQALAGGAIDLDAILTVFPVEETVLAKFCFMASRKLKDFFPVVALQLAEKTFQLNPLPLHGLWAVQLLYKQGHLKKMMKIIKAANLVNEFYVDNNSSLLLSRVIDAFEIFENGFSIPLKRPEPAYNAKPRTTAYLLNRSLATDAVGYTHRTHKVLKAIQENFRDHIVYPVVGPTYDIETGSHYVDGIVYDHLNAGTFVRGPLTKTILSIADEFEKYAREKKVARIVAASNFRTGLAGLIAARRLGIPFVYDVRGFWYLTAASKKEGWEHTDQYAADQAMEILVMKEADHILTISDTMRQYIGSLGVDIEKVTLFPNACDPLPVADIERQQAIRNELGLNDYKVVTFIGSLTPYEGLNDLVDAFFLLSKIQDDVRLLIVGDGQEREKLEAIVATLNLDDKVVFTGKVPQGEVHHYMRLSNVLTLPRKPIPVCQVVTPLKIYEYLQSGVPVVASDLPPLKEIATNGGMLFFKQEKRIAELLENILEAFLLEVRVSPKAYPWEKVVIPFLKG